MLRLVSFQFLDHSGTDGSTMCDSLAQKTQPSGTVDIKWQLLPNKVSSRFYRVPPHGDMLSSFVHIQVGDQKISCNWSEADTDCLIFLTMNILVKETVQPKM